MQRDTLSETNIAPENRPFPKESSHPSTIVEGYVRFRECLDDIVQVLNKEKHLLQKQLLYKHIRNWLMHKSGQIGTPELQGNYEEVCLYWTTIYRVRVGGIGNDNKSSPTLDCNKCHKGPVDPYQFDAHILVLLVPSIYVYTYCNYTWMWINVWDLKHQEYGLKMFVSKKQTHVLPLQDSSFKSINEFQ